MKHIYVAGNEDFGYTVVSYDEIIMAQIHTIECTIMLCIGRPGIWNNRCQLTFTFC